MLTTLHVFENHVQKKQQDQKDSMYEFSQMFKEVSYVVETHKKMCSYLFY